jgi:hypothetical protein
MTLTKPRPIFNEPPANWFVAASADDPILHKVLTNNKTGWIVWNRHPVPLLSQKVLGHGIAAFNAFSKGVLWPQKQSLLSVLGFLAYYSFCFRLQ